MLLLTNTKTRKKEPVPSTDGTVRMYTCGPTVYAFAHIGNFRTFVAEDLLRRTLRFFGFTVNQVMNLTDVDDKTIKGALENKVTLQAFTEPFKKAFFEDLDALRIERAEHYPEATRFIAQMITMIETLIQKRIAYIGADGSVYYGIRHFPCYGSLSHLKMDELEVNASERMATDEYTKDHVSDFVLWKKHDRERDGDIFWESPFGPGRPGWHIECSVMAEALLGKTVDIHAGGVDLIFPHHENEIAQSEACFDKEFCKLWFHVEHLLVDHKKMSKSLGNFYTLRDLLQLGFTGNEVRFMLLSTHYRSQLNFTKETMHQSRAALGRIGDFILRLQSVTTEKSSDDALFSEVLHKTREHFRAALADDLNISGALAALFDFVRWGNGILDTLKLSKGQAGACLQLLHTLDTVLGIMPFEAQAVPDTVMHLALERQQARAQRDFARADALRKELHDMGYLVEDTSTGIRVKKTNISFPSA